MTDSKNEPGGKAADNALDLYGIKRVSTDHFEFGGYRYSSVEHAVAEAKRRQAGTSR